MQVSAADQVDTVAAQRAARKAKILASGKDRLGRITKSHNDQASINDITNAGHLHSKANDAEESEREKEPPKLSESLSWASIESVHGSFDSLTGIPVDTAPTTFAPAFKSYSSTSRARAADMGRLATLERVQFIVISLGATTCMLVWIYMTGHLNHPAEMQLEPLTSEWARQVCRNLNYIARNPVSSAQFPALRLPLGDSAMPIWGIFLSLEAVFLSLRWITPHPQQFKLPSLAATAISFVGVNPTTAETIISSLWVYYEMYNSLMGDVYVILFTMGMFIICAYLAELSGMC